MLHLLFGKHRALYTSAQPFSNTMFELLISNSLPIIASTSVKTADICCKRSTEQTWLFIEFVNLTVKKRERKSSCERVFADKVDCRWRQHELSIMVYGGWGLEKSLVINCRCVLNAGWIPLVMLLPQAH